MLPNALWCRFEETSLIYTIVLDKLSHAMPVTDWTSGFLLRTGLSLFHFLLNIHPYPSNQV